MQADYPKQTYAMFKIAGFIIKIVIIYVTNLNMKAAYHKET